MWWFRWDSESYSGSDTQQTTRQWPWPFFWCKVGFGKCFGVLLRPTTELVVVWNPLFITCLNLIEKWFVIVVWTKRRWHFKTRIFFLFAVSSWGTHLSRLFTFPICFKCIMTIERSTLSSLATFYVVVKGSALMVALSWSLSTSSDQPLCSSSSRLSFPLQNFFSLHCTVYIHYRFLGQMRCWCCELSQLLYACFELEHHFHSLNIKYTVSNKSLAKNMKQEMHIKMMYDIIAFKNVF